MDLDRQRYCELARPSDWASDRIVGIIHRRNGYLSEVAKKLIRNLAASSLAIFGEISVEPVTTSDIVR
jgi:hypothetical protein